MDDLKIKELEAKEVKDILRELKPLLPESDEYSHTVDNYVKLRKLQMEREKAEKERLDQHIHKAIGYTLDISKFAAGLAVYYALYKIGLKFEETGSISSHPMRDLIGSINPFRKK